QAIPPTVCNTVAVWQYHCGSGSKRSTIWNSMISTLTVSSATRSVWQSTPSTVISTAACCGPNHGICTQRTRRDMWAVAKRYSQGELLLYYTGSNGNWSNDQTRAARWIDARDAWQAIKDNNFSGVAELVFVSNPRKADPDQVVPEAVLQMAKNHRV